MDQKDIHIVQALQDNARLTNQDLAERVNLSPSPCLRRMKNLEDNGIIKGYRATVDQKAFGFALTVFIHIKLSNHTEDIVKNFERHIRASERVLECFLMTGRWDYMLRVVALDLEDYERFVRSRLQPISSVGSIESNIIYGTIKSQSVLPSPV